MKVLYSFFSCGGTFQSLFVSLKNGTKLRNALKRKEIFFYLKYIRQKEKTNSWETEDVWTKVPVFLDSFTYRGGKLKFSISFHCCANLFWASWVRTSFLWETIKVIAWRQYKHTNHICVQILLIPAQRIDASVALFARNLYPLFEAISNFFWIKNYTLWIICCTDDNKPLSTLNYTLQINVYFFKNQWRVSVWFFQGNKAIKKQ